jgi:hypothetical protein
VTTLHAENARARAVLVACALVIAAVLLPTLGFAFSTWDDPEHVTQNPAVQAPFDTSLRSHLLTPQLGYPIPVTVATFTLNRALFGPDAASFHALNALLHLAVCVLVYALARRFGMSRAAASTCTVVFALHPVVAEPVSWVTGRKDLLAALLSLAAVWLALSARRFAYAGSVACYALALLSKPVAAPVALLCLLAPHIDARHGARRPNATAALRRFVPYLVLLVPIAVAGLNGQREVGAVDNAAQGISRAHAAWYALGHHLSLVFFMEEPTAKYTPASWPPSLLDPRTSGACLLLVALGALGAWTLRGQGGRAAAFGISWAGLTYVPSSSILFPITRYLADSFVYLPLIGFAWSLGAAIDAVLAQLSVGARGIARALPLAVAIGMAPMFLSSSQRFHDDVTLWSQAHDRFPHHPRICRQWANAIATVHGPQPGLAATDLCIGQFGDTIFAKNRGILLMQLGRLDEATFALQSALRRKPGDDAAQKLLGQVAAARARTPQPESP